MGNLRLVTIEGETNPEDKKVIVEGMLAYHASHGHPRKTEVLNILLKDEQNKVVGSVIVTFLWNGMEIQTLWVDETIRHQGWGTKLLQTAETEGIKRGATIAYTNTFSWQAPEFYAKLGYELYGKLENFPKGESLSYWSKKLT